MANRGRLSRHAAWVLVACGLPLLCGCGAGPLQNPGSAKRPGGHLRVSGGHGLFEGKELKRLERHLRLTAGCVQIEADDQVRYLDVMLDVWENGKAKPLREGYTGSSLAPG